MHDTKPLDKLKYDSANRLAVPYITMVFRTKLVQGNTQFQGEKFTHVFALFGFHMADFSFLLLNV